MLRNLDRRQVVIGAAVAVLVVAVGLASYLTHRNNGTAAPSPSQAATLPGAAVPTDGPSAPSQAAVPAPTPGETASFPAYPAGGQEGGADFDINNPPAGAPSTADLKKGRDNARNYFLAVSQYGYGDKTIRDLADRAKPYMTDTAWADLDAAMSEPTAGDQDYWNTMVNQKRHITVAIDQTVVTSWTADSVTFGISYRQANNVSGQVDQNIMHQEKSITVVADAGRWRVDSASAAS